MPMPVFPILRFTLGGDCFPGETWDIGLDLEISTEPVGIAPTQAELDTIADQVMDVFTSVFWSPALDFYNDASVNFRRASVRYYSLGVLRGSGTAAQTAVPGTGTATHPGYTAMVVTHLTPTPTRRGRGRRYLPFTAGGVDLATGQFQASALSAISAAWVDFIEAVEALVFVIEGDPVSAATIVLSETGGTTALVTSIRIDSRPDVQRGRVRSTAPLNQVSVPIVRP